MGDRFMLHYICMCLQLRWSSQLVLIASFVATIVKAFVFDLLTALSSDFDNNGYDEHVTLFHRTNSGQCSFTHTLVAHLLKCFILQYQTFFGNYILTILVAIVATLAFESPIVILEKLIFSPTKKPERIDNNVE